MRALLLIILITLPFQIKKCNTILPQTDDVESSITIQRKQRRIFLFNYTEDLLKTGLILNFFMSKKTGKLLQT